jgi:predicted aminopeptidase
VRAFAVASLGLKDTKSYESVVELDADRLATVVSACAALSFDRFLWSYPLVGKLPYRGYFDPALAEAEAARLRGLGFDVIARPVDAFSTLGWLADPLFSFMSSYDEAEIADLLIHEMTHATVFAKGNRPGVEQFNEELATYVGREGSLRYLEKKYGPDSPELDEARRANADAETFSAYLRDTSTELEAVYASGDAPEEKRRRKAEIIAARAATYARRYDELFASDRYRDFPMARLNNAYLDLYRLYEGEPELYADYCAKLCGGDLRRFIAAMARIAKAGGDPKRTMRKELGEEP